MELDLLGGEALGSSDRSRFVKYLKYAGVYEFDLVSRMSLGIKFHGVFSV